ncbi:hypothetical protein Tco_1414022 [Tanacetum coccineum]
MEVFIGGLPRSIEGNVTALKRQTLEETITITQRLMEQVIKHNSAQETNDHKRKFEDRRNTTDNNNYPNDRNNNNHSKNHNNDNYQNNHNNHNRNNDYHQQQNRRQETIRTYAATPTENKRLASAVICQKWGCYTPPPPPAHARTMPQRIARLEEDVFSTWVTTGLGWMMDRAGVAYTSYAQTHVSYQRCVRQRIGEASTSTVQQDPQ